MRMFGLLIVTAACIAAAPPASAPTTATLRLEDMEALADGIIRFIPPPQWELINKTPDGLAARYRSRDGRAVIDITVMPQTRTIHDSAKQQMALIIGKGIREAAAANGQQLVVPPRVEPDDRFYLKMHDAMSGGAMIADRVQMYRIIGLNLVHVAATAQVENLEESRDVHELAEQTLHTMRIARGSKRVVYPKAQLRAIVPLNWKDTKTDNPNGLVATYIDPKEPSRQILISGRVIPKVARDDEEKRKALLEKMVDQERTLPSRPAIQKSEEQDVAGTKYLRQIRYTLKKDAAGGPQRVDTRYLVVGDVLVSVRSIAREADADAVAAIADKVAADLKPLHEPKD